MRTSENRALGGGVSRVIAMLGMLGLIVGLGTLASRPARAEVQNDLVGFSSNHVFESADAAEHIDAMSGNMTLTIPIGPRYKLTESFGYGLTLYYNSKIWEHECPEGRPTQDHPCPGSLPPDSGVGLGFSLLPGRVYHHPDDKSYVYRMQLEDGSEHFFCNGNPEGSNCDFMTTDGTDIQMWSETLAGGQLGWRAVLPDGRRIIFGKVLNNETKDVLATRLETAERRPGTPSSPAAAVDYAYDSPDNQYAVTSITDSQGRSTFLTYTNDSYTERRVTITVPTFVNPVGASPAPARYVLHLHGIPYKDPSDHANTDTHPRPRDFLWKIDFPELAESYGFAYERTGWTTFGWLLQRTLPTGAIIDYYYDVYSTSDFRPYHTQLRYKILTIGRTPSSSGTSYRWSWNRFEIGPAYSPSLPDPVHPPAGTGFAGSNPYQAWVLDPFDNLTVYGFLYTGYDTRPGSSTCNHSYECVNNWSDGLLDHVSTYVGPDPDSSRLVRRVEYKWESDIDTTTHANKMFQYRASSGASVNYPTVHSMAVNARQSEERTLVPTNGGSPVHTVRVTHADWSFLCPRQTNEYVDDVLYRSTDTHAMGAGCLYPDYVQVNDAAGNVVSRVDRKYSNTRLQCEVSRKGTSDTYDNSLDDCGPALVLAPGDVATINGFDPITSVTTSTTTKGGDDSNIPERVVTMDYLMANNERTGYLTKKQFNGLTWKAVDRVVDFNTGLTSTTHDTAGNTTTYSWDGLGRLKEIRPASNEKPTIITYPNIHETRVRQELSSGNFIETIYSYDDLGRLIKTQRRNITGDYDVQKTEYDIVGRVTRKSEWAPAGTADANFKWTTYDYTMYTDLDAPSSGVAKHPDPLGRIHGVTTPDDLTPLTPTTETTYSGNVTTVTVREIQGWNGYTSTPVIATTVYTNDPLGRLISVDAPGTGADAQYAYDERDNLTEVRLTDPTPPVPPDTAHAQLRQFEYDRLGRLRRASNPENGTVEYIAYDARGNLLKYMDARQNTFTMSYDNADRLTTRSQKVGNGSVVLASNAYDETSLGFDPGGSKGHLVEQNSYKLNANGATSLVSRVRFGYGAVNGSEPCAFGDGGYSGLNGRLKWQRTAMPAWGSPLIDLETDYCQDALGMPTTVFYPDTTSQPSHTPRSKVSPAYQNGYLKQLGDAGRNVQYITNVVYEAGGVPKEIDRVASKDLVDLDIRNRPKRFRAVSVPPGGTIPSQPGIYPEIVPVDPLEGGEPEDPGGAGGGGTPGYLWDSGDYAYDMAGNVKTIGLERHYYDAMSRLVHSTVPSDGTTYDLGFAFDAFGNMTGQTRTTSGSSLERTYVTDWRTNRLTQQTVIGGTTVGYAYDANGNMTADNVTPAGGRGFVYDGEGRLREVMDPEKGRIGNYDYDAAGYRVRVEADGNETFLFRDASGQVLSEFQRRLGDSAAPVWNKDYIYAFGKSFGLARNLKPPAPPRPVANPVSTTALTLSWPPVDAPDLDHYTLLRHYKASAFANELLHIYSIPASPTTMSWSDSYAAAGSDTYLTYTLTAYDTAGNVSKSGPTLIVYPGAQNLPSRPSNVTAASGDKSVMIRWNPVTLPHNDLLGYFVERQDPGSETFVQLNAVALTVCEFLDTPLINNQTYWYRVRTVDTSNRYSQVPAPPVSGTPNDTIKPGKILDVGAEPDRVAGRIHIYWKRGGDTDVASYKVYRRTDALLPTSSDFLDTVSVPVYQPGQAWKENYDYYDTPTPVQKYYYSIIAVDNATVPNVSDASDPASARARITVSDPPHMVLVAYDPKTTGAPSTEGIPQGFPADTDIGNRFHMGNIDAEDDDLVQATITFYPGSPIASGYRVYRKAPDETHFTRLPDLPIETGQNYVVHDVTLAKGDYTYFVVGVNSSGDEIANATPATPAGTELDSFSYHADWAHVSVRNLNVIDGRDFYTTDNKNSRLATIKWSRVTEPELVGYNIYRMCPFYNNCSVTTDTMEHFACESVWIRLNTAPIPREQRWFRDSATGGLEGCFNYAVRPVGPNGVEGPIVKIVAADLVRDLMPQYQTGAARSFAHFMANASVAPLCLDPPDPPPGQPACPRWSTTTPPVSCPNYCLTYRPGAECPNYCGVSYKYILDESPGPPYELPAINTIQRGTADPTLPVPTPTAVTKDILDKPEIDSRVQGESRFARISWTMTMTNAPSDLLGFHVETAGSPRGPWQRLTKHPVAWWERNYITQGVGIARCDAYSGHTDCLRYRVIAVDEAGNESVPSTVALDSTCPKTPDPPTNLRASTSATSPACTTRLDWDPSTTGATEYYVYRTIIMPYGAYFYDTQRVALPGSAPPSHYEEIGDPHDQGNGATCYPDLTCPLFTGDPPNTYQCSQFYLAAYYVTARNENLGGGESPRSNLVFWKCGTGFGTGYDAKLLREEMAFDAIAALTEHIPTDRLACWNTDAANPDDFGKNGVEPPDLVRPVGLTNVPMLRLGTISDPPWTFYDLHTDHLGSVRAVTNLGSTLVANTGAELVSLHNYFPFGEEVPQQLSYNTHQYTGHERDHETGLDYMLARYYEAGLGRFLSVDPVSGLPSMPQTWNAYTYGRNNPLRFFDPTGTTDEQALKAIQSLSDTDVQKEMGAAMDTAGAESPNPDQTREAVGGIGETVIDGKGSGDFKAFSIVRADATPGTGGDLPTGKEISQKTGGAPVADFHTHQLADRTHDRQKEQGTAPSTQDVRAAKERGMPGLVVSRTQVSMAWEDNKGKMQTATVMTFKGVDSLKAGSVTVVTPKQLSK